jgi:hypothetical protein
MTCGHSLRDWQHRTSEALQGKAFDRSTPLGPILVSPDALDDARDLAVVCDIDGQIRQRGSTRDLLFRPAELVAYISQFLTPPARNTDVFRAVNSAASRHHHGDAHVATVMSTRTRFLGDQRTSGL